MAGNDNIIINMDNLANHCLIATPQITDPLFKKSVVYITHHDPNVFAAGLIINQPIANNFSQKNLFEQLILPTSAIADDAAVYRGGPLRSEIGLILHSGEKFWTHTIKISPHINLTFSKDILEDIAGNKGPRQSIICLGYCVWGKSQLENEIARNDWIICTARNELLFDVPSELMWISAGAELGINVQQLPSDGQWGGHA